IISGVPLAAAATANYVVTASNASGFTTSTLSITVNPAAPTNLTYSTNPATYTVGTPIIPNVPSSSGGTPTAYSVSPVLPAGLSLNSLAGIITGVPTAATPTANYVVTASNGTGSTTATLSITVDPAAPSGLTYSSNPATYTVGTPITPNVPTS